jgi:type I restriction enzyme S subunit
MDYSWVLPENIIDRLDSLPYKRVYIDNLKRLKKHKTQKLFKICDSVKCGPFGSTVLAETYSNEGVLYIRPVNISNNLFDESDLVFLDRLDVRKKNLDIFTNNDLFFGRVGNPCVSKVSKEYSEITISPNIIGVKVGDKIDSDYLWMFLSSRYGIFQIERMLKTVAQPTTSTETIKELDVLVPLPEIQKYIGDKVRKAEELREKAKRLKKEAEEILNKELNLKDVEFYIKQTNNKKYSWTESIEIEDRIDSEFYKPKYRYLSKLNNMSELSYYYKISKKRINKNIDRKIKYIDLSSVNNIIEPSDFNTKELPSRAQFLVKEGNLIISTLKGSNKISIIPEHLNDSVCSTGFIVIASKSHLTTEYLYLVFSNKVFNMQIERYSTGSIMSGVNHDNFNKMLIPVISNKQIIDTITNKIRKHFRFLYYSKQLIQEAKQDVEDLIEGNFDMSKVKANN